MDWQILLTAFAGALGGTATALLIAGTLGKGLIDQWLKKDFKKFELKLEAIENTNQVKLSSLHAERVAAVKEIYPKCQEIFNKVSIIIGARVSDNFNKDPAFVHVIDNLAGTLLENQNQLRRYVKDRSYLFREGEPELIEKYVHNSHVVVFQKTMADENGSFAKVLEETANSAESLPKDRDAIEAAFKKILGSDTL